MNRVLRRTRRCREGAICDPILSVSLASRHPINRVENYLSKYTAVGYHLINKPWEWSVGNRELLTAVEGNGFCGQTHLSIAIARTSCVVIDRIKSSVGVG